MANPIDLTIHVSSDVTDATAGMDQVAAAADSMGSAVDDAATKANSATSSMDGLSSATDGVASKTGVMTGAMGALSGGLAAVGLEKYATALEGAAVATDTISGASDLLTLALESEKVQSVLTTASTIAHKVAMVASTVATNVMAAAQRALNLVMSANPIGLVVAALTLLVAGLVLAYNKSDSFREIVDKAGQVAVAAFDAISTAVEKAIGWIKDVPGKVQDIYDKASSVAGAIAGFFTSMFEPIQTAIDWVQDLIDKLDVIPDINIPGFGRTTTGGATAAGAGANVSINVSGALDPYQVGRQVEKALARTGLIVGRVTP